MNTYLSAPSSRPTPFTPTKTPPQELWHPSSSSTQPPPSLLRNPLSSLYTATMQPLQPPPSHHRVVNPKGVKDVVFASGMFQPHDQHDAQVCVCFNILV